MQGELLKSPIQLAEFTERAVTSTRRAGTPVAERKRRQRQRERERNLIYERDDWQLFMDLSTLPQKAGCHFQDLYKVVLKELVDNALDAGANVSLQFCDGAWVVSDDGPGIAPGEVPKLFSVNRPLLSSKLKRLPLRGMLGNGLRVVMGAVAATEGGVIVETRGHRLTLAIDTATGKALLVADESIPQAPGLTVRLILGESNSGQPDAGPANQSISIAKCGRSYSGPSSPWWYGGRDLYRLFAHVTPAHTTVASVCRDLGIDCDDERAARTLSPADAEHVLEALCASSKPVPPERLGFIGADFHPDWPGYARKAGVVSTQAGAKIPWVVEAWAHCVRSQQKGQGNVEVDLIVNRSMTLASLHAVSFPSGIFVKGCGLHRYVRGPGTGDYKIALSVIAPYVQLATDGKEPELGPFSEGIAQVMKKACGVAHRALERPERSVSKKEAAWSVMAEAYQVASGDGRYPANARQIMYAARPAILALTGKTSLDDAYFTQTLLPDYIEEYPQETAHWDVVFDARGNFIEPHTGREVGLGTIEVREYVGDRLSVRPAVGLDCRELFPTSGPLHRYSAVLFIEKEGFTPLLRTAQIAERFDIAIMSTKGMSVTAARMLLDRLSPHIERVLVLHDFDVAGFSIFGTLGSDGRRYKFQNKVPLLDIGLRLEDVEALELQAEPVETSGSWQARAETLEEHGATDEEIDFLRHRRVELNAMTAPVFVAFLEEKLALHGIKKVVPNARTVELHARRVMEQVRAEKALQEVLKKIRQEAAVASLPPGLLERLKKELISTPEIPWDRAVADVVRQDCATQ